jgi:AcrR family transcriptional regulator
MAVGEMIRDQSRPRRTQAERSAESRRKLVQAAIDCICDYGFVESTVARISMRAGLTRGAVQHHFGTREELLLAVLDDFGTQMVRMAAQPSVRGLPLEERIQTLFRRNAEIFRSRHFIANIQIWLNMKDPAIERTWQDMMLAFERDLDDRWREDFAETGLSPERIVVLRRIANSALRGLAVRALYLNDHNDWVEEIAILEDMLLRHLKG